MKQNILKCIMSCFIVSMFFILSNCSDDDNNTGGGTVTPPTIDTLVAERNMERAMAIADASISHYFVGDDMKLSSSYNPFTQKRSPDYSGIFEYTAAMEMANAILKALNTHKEHGNVELYNANYQRYLDFLYHLEANLNYCRGSFHLTSFTRNNVEWHVYSVGRSNTRNTADVEGRMNVYDDQLWLIIELLRSYKVTKDPIFLNEAEYLMEYVLDGWDSTIDQATGLEVGGTPWGPGYVTKHSASNGPSISPLVWLYEIYKDKEDVTTHYYIKANRTRTSEQMKKKDYYLMFAKKIYAWQKKNMRLESGVYSDMQGGCGDCNVEYEVVDGVTYRANTPLDDAVGGEYSYNTGSMLMGACDLYRVTNEADYLADIKELGEKSFNYFAKPIPDWSGYYNFEGSTSARVLLWGYLDAYPYDSRTASYIDSFQKLFDYAYQTHLQDGILPEDLYEGWNSGSQSVIPMLQFSYAAEFALFSEFELIKKKRGEN